MANLIPPAVSVQAGITELPDFLADPDKWKTLQNRWPLRQSGQVCRPGTQWKAGPPTVGKPQKMVVPLDYGGRDRYLAVVGHDEIKVFLRNGTEVPVRAVTYTAGLPTAGGDPDFSYLDLRTETAYATPQQLDSSDTLATADWVESGDAGAPAIGIGPIKPLAFPDPGTPDAHKYSELDHQATGTLAEWTQGITGSMWAGLTDVSIYVNTLIDGGALRTTNSATLRLHIQSPAGPNTDKIGLELDWGSGITSPPEVVTNTGDVVPLITQLGTNDFLVGFVFDPARVTTGSAGTVNVIIGLDDGAVGGSAGLYAGDITIGFHGEIDQLTPYAQPPEILRHVTVGNSTYFANPLVATRADHVTLATSFADVYGSRVFTGDPASFAIVDAAYIYAKVVSTLALDHYVEVSLNAGVDTWTVSRPGVAAEGSEDLMGNLLTDLQGDAANTDGTSAIVEFTRLGSVIKAEVKTGNTLDYIRVHDDSGDSVLAAWHNSVELISDLAETAQDDTRALLLNPEDSPGEGTARTSNADIQPNVVVRFVADDAGAFGKGHWKEGLDYNLETSLDGSTLPHVLTRRQDTSTGTVLSTSDPYGIYFEWAEHSWNDRIAGDDTTNPYPSFITPTASEDVTDRTVDAIGYTQNRLVLASHANVSFSAPSRLGVFLRTTIQSVPDNQRIDVVASSAEASPYFDALSASGDLFLRSKKSIDLVTYDGVLSPRTVGIEPVFKESTTELVSGAAAFTGLIAAQRGTTADRVKFLHRTEEGLDGSIFSDIDISEDVPELVGDRVNSLAWSPDIKMLFLATREKPTQILAARFDPNAEDHPIAWSSMRFNGDSVESLAILDDDLFILVYRADGWHIESIPLTVSPIDSGQAWMARLDRRITEQDLLSVPAFAASVTTLFMPYDIVSTSRVKVVHRDGSDFGVDVPIASFDVSTPGAHEIRLTGDQTGENIFIGETFVRKGIPRRPILRNRETPAVSVDMTVSTVTTAVRDTGWLDVLVRNTDSAVSIPATAGTYPVYDGESTTAVTQATRRDTHSIGSDPDSFELEINNSTVKPTNLAGLEWHVAGSDRGQRVRV